MCNHLTNFAILMDVIDDTAQFVQQIGLFDENMRILISISIAICIVFVVIALLTLKFFNGIFIKVRTTQQQQQQQTHHHQHQLQLHHHHHHQQQQQHGQNDTLQTNTSNNELSSFINLEQQQQQQQQRQNHFVNDGCANAMNELNPMTCQSMMNHIENPQNNSLTMPNNDCTINAVNSLSERMQNYQHFHHHYHHHHHFHLPPPPIPSEHGNSHNHFVFNSNVFNANTVNSANVGLKLATANDNGHADGTDLIVNLRKGESNNENDGGGGVDGNGNDDGGGNDNGIGGCSQKTPHSTQNNENFPMTQVGNANNFIARGHLQGHLHSHYPRFSQQIV